MRTDVQPPPLLSESLEDDGSVRSLQPNGRRDSRLIACLISTILHTALFIALGLFSLHVASSNRLTIEIQRTPPAESVTFETPVSQEENVLVDTSLAEREEAVVIAPAAANEVASPLQDPVDSAAMPPLTGIERVIAGDTAAAAMTTRLPTGGGLSGRTAEGRRLLGQQYGATAASEDAVENALRWLAAHQRRNGSWSFDLELAPCNGRCRHGREIGDTPTPATGATGLAILAFLGAGYTQHEGKYAQVVADGLYYLRSVATETNAGLDWQMGSMYSQGIALLALNEALSMSRRDDLPEGDRDLRDLAQQGTKFTMIAQHKNGSWGYVPGQPGDTTLSGWQVFSLIAARRNRIPLYYHTLPRAKEFLLSTSEAGEYAFGYQAPPAEPTTTAIGLTMLMYLGHSPYEPKLQEALDQLAKRGPTGANVYHDYYGTLALHLARHHGWHHWNNQLRDHLVRTQATAGHEAGSWHFKDRHGDVGGRLYTTAMATMILEIYYRYMPLYQDPEAFPLE